MSSKKEPPLVKGGQGRSADEVVSSARWVGICIVAVVALVAFYALAWAIGLDLPMAGG